MSNEKDKPKKEAETTEPEEEYIVKYENDGKSKTGAGNIYNINIQIGQPPLPPYKP